MAFINRFACCCTASRRKGRLSDNGRSDPQRGEGFFDNSAKVRCRSDLISHAIRCLTKERDTSACVQRGHVKRVWNQLRESGESRAYFDPRVIKSIEAGISQWESFHKSKIEPKEPSHLNVCYLGGNDPTNDLKVLVDNGVLPQNVWAVEKAFENLDETRKAIRESKLTNVRLFNGDIRHFFREFEGNFDIIYFDACGTLPSADQHTLQAIGLVFQYNKLTSPGALITNFSFPPKIDERGEDPLNSKNSKQRELIKELVIEYLKYRLTNTWMNKGSEEQNAEFLGKRSLEDNYGDYITYQIIDSAYLFIPALRMLSSTKTGRSSSLCNQVFESEKFLKLLDEYKTSFDGVTESSSATGKKEKGKGKKKSSATEETVANESFGAYTGGASNAGNDSCSKESSTLKSISKDSPLRKCGHAMEDRAFCNKHCRAWVNEILPDWKSMSKLSNNKLQFLLLTHLLSYFDYFLSEYTNDDFRKQCIEPLFKALHSDNDQGSSSSGDHKAVFPKFHDAVDLSNTRSLVAGLLYGQMAYPSFPVVDKMLRLHYIGHKRQMFADVFIFDQCRYVYQQFPSTDFASFAITEPEQQMVFRMVVNGLRKHLEGICSQDVFPSCHVASIDPIPRGKIGFPNSRPQIPKRKKV